MAQKNNVVEFAPISEDVCKQVTDVQDPNILPDALSLPHNTGDITPIGLALGGGAARGWAHIGVLRALDEAQIPVQMIAGTSIGALVGGCYLAGKLDELEEFARSITRWNVLRYMDFAVKASGLISGKRLADRMDGEIGDMLIEDLDRRFIAIATDIVTGSEIWLKHGSLSQAIRASYALPGVFQPVQHFGRQMVDGALVNPVPVSACRAFEAPVVMAVNLNSLVLGRAAVVQSSSIEKTLPSEPAGLDMDGGSWFDLMGGGKRGSQKARMGVAGVMIEAFNIIQDRIARSRLAGDPPDIAVRPDLQGIGLSDFHKADEAIDRGYEIANSVVSEIKRNHLA